MDDAEFLQQKQRIMAIAEQWVRPLGLGYWRVDLGYDRDGSDFADTMQTVGAFESGAAARCFPDWRYCIATVVFNMPRIAHLDDEELEGIVVHELMHIFLHEMRERSGALGHEERVATSLAKGFIWIRDRARDGEWGKSDD